MAEEKAQGNGLSDEEFIEILQGAAGAFDPNEASKKMAERRLVPFTKKYSLAHSSSGGIIAMEGRSASKNGKGLSVLDGGGQKGRFFYTVKSSYMEDKKIEDTGDRSPEENAARREESMAPKLIEDLNNKVNKFNTTLEGKKKELLSLIKKESGGNLSEDELLACQEEIDSVMELELSMACPQEIPQEAMTNFEEAPTKDTHKLVSASISCKDLYLNKKTSPLGKILSNTKGRLQQIDKKKVTTYTLDSLGEDAPVLRKIEFVKYSYEVINNLKTLKTEDKAKYLEDSGFELSRNGRQVRLRLNDSDVRLISSSEDDLMVEIISLSDNQIPISKPGSPNWGVNSEKIDVALLNAVDCFAKSGGKPTLENIIRNYSSKLNEIKTRYSTKSLELSETKRAGTLINKAKDVIKNIKGHINEVVGGKNQLSCIETHLKPIVKEILETCQGDLDKINSDILESYILASQGELDVYDTISSVIEDKSRYGGRILTLLKARLAFLNTQFKGNMPIASYNTGGFGANAKVKEDVVTIHFPAGNLGKSHEKFKVMKISELCKNKHYKTLLVGTSEGSEGGCNVIVQDLMKKNNMNEDSKIAIGGYSAKITTQMFRDPKTGITTGSITETNEVIKPIMDNAVNIASKYLAALEAGGKLSEEAKTISENALRGSSDTQRSFINRLLKKKVKTPQNKKDLFDWMKGCTFLAILGKKENKKTLIKTVSFALVGNSDNPLVENVHFTGEGLSISYDKQRAKDLIVSSLESLSEDSFIPSKVFGKDGVSVVIPENDNMKTKCGKIEIKIIYEKGKEGRGNSYAKVVLSSAAIDAFLPSGDHNKGKCSQESK